MNPEQTGDYILAKPYVREATEEEREEFSEYPDDFYLVLEHELGYEYISVTNDEIGGVDFFLPHIDPKDEDSREGVEFRNFYWNGLDKIAESLGITDPFRESGILSVMPYEVFIDDAYKFQIAAIKLAADRSNTDQARLEQIISEMR